MVGAVAAAPTSARPLEVMDAALEAGGDFFGEGQSRPPPPADHRGQPESYRSAS